MIKWSFSSLKKFVTCPRQYYEVRVAGNYKEPEIPQATYGKEVHKALEDYINSNTPLPSNYKRFQKYADVIKQIPGTRYTELKMALDIDGNSCDFESENYWVRGIGDLVIVDHEEAYYIDYKTGKDRYADKKQLKLMSAMIFRIFPKVRSVKSALLFLSNGNFMPEEFTRSQEEELWMTFHGDLVRLRHSISTNYWPENPSGLCRRHCVVVDCPHHGRD